MRISTTAAQARDPQAGQGQGDGHGTDRRTGTLGATVGPKVFRFSAGIVWQPLPNEKSS